MTNITANITEEDFPPRITTRQQLAEKISDGFLRWAHRFGSGNKPGIPRYEIKHGKCPDARIDREGCRKWIIAALLAGYGVAEDSDDWYASYYKLAWWEEDNGVDLS